MPSLDEELADLLSVVLALPVTPDTPASMATLPAWDSIKHIEIIMAVEEHFGISFAPEDIPRLTSQERLLAGLRELKAHV